jgi:indolepyruvate ferredoxin oxidoreductase beta subunit
MADRPIKLTIAALGGQGGGVLAGWLIEIAESEGYLAQSTSVPGVAQRTGATIYYLEFFPREAAVRAGREPVMALMPVAGDVDCVVASELAEAGRAVQRGLVTPDRTTLIASSHRSYVIAEKMSLGRGAVDSEGLVELLRSHAKRLVLFDMADTAERHQSVISSVLLGALCGSDVLPFRKQSFVDEIVRSGIAVKANVAAFEDALQRAQRGDSGFTGRVPAKLLPEVPERASTPGLQPLLDRVRNLPAAVQAVVLEGVRRTIDYQDPAYAATFMERVEKIAAVEAGSPTSTGSHVLLDAVARSLALWMTFEDTIRVADLKTRAARFLRVRDEIRADPGQLFGITDFMKPRVMEIAGTLPAGLGRRVLASPRLRGWLGVLTGGRRIRTGTIGGFLLLYSLAGCKRWRRRTLRFAEETQRIEAWLARIQRLAATNPALAVQLARAQTLIKGYGETHERGWRNFSLLVDQLDFLAPRTDGADWLARLQDAALADEEGQGLAQALAALGTHRP